MRELETLPGIESAAALSILPYSFYDLRTLEDMAGARVSQPRYNAFLVSLFATLALMLAAVGIYGVLSFAVRRRTREMGLRLAIGAQRWDVLRLAVGQGMRLVLAGLGSGWWPQSA